MDRLTIPDEPIEGGTRRAVIDARAVKEQAMTLYWKLKRYEDTGLEPKDVTTAKSLAIQYLKETIDANEKSIQLGRKDGTDVTCICEANKDLEKVLLKLVAGYQEN